MNANLQPKVVQASSPVPSSLLETLALTVLRSHGDSVPVVTEFAEALGSSAAFCFVRTEQQSVHYISAGPAQPSDARVCSYPDSVFQSVLYPSCAGAVDPFFQVEIELPNCLGKFHLLGRRLWVQEQCIGGFGLMLDEGAEPSAVQFEALTVCAEVFHHIALNVRQSTTRFYELERLLGSEANFVCQSVLDSVLEGVSCCDQDGFLVYANPAMEKIVGLSLEEMRGRRMYEFLYSPDSAEYRNAQAAQHQRYQARLGGVDEEYEVQSDWPSGNSRCLLVRASPLRNSAGEIVGSVGLIADHTEKRSLENQLLWSQKMDAVGRLARNVAHDFNNLLTVILGQCDRLSQEVPAESPQVRRCAAIVEASKSAATLTQQLLNVSKRKVVQKQAQDVNALVRDIQAILCDFVSEGVQIELSLQSGLLPVLVDGGQLQQVLINLAINGRDAMPDGGVLRFSTYRLDMPGERGDRASKSYIAVSVSDTGIGMSDEVLAHLYEPFYSTKQDGNGLGLSITHSIVEQHGGRIHVSSRLGEGSTFTVLLPEANSAAKNFALEARPAHDRIGDGQQILLVEDESVVRELVAESLSDKGFSVRCAVNGLAAQEILQAAAHELVLVLSDVSMPKMDGVQLAEYVRTNYPDLPIVLMSGCMSDSALPEHISEQSIPFIAKPFLIESLVQLVQEQLSLCEEDASKRLAKGS